MSGIEPKKRSLPDYLQTGIVIVNKPCGPSSHQVSGWVRDIFGLTKTGHFGTLDPEVSGVLPVALGKITKLAPYFMKKEKEYVCIMRFHKDVDINLVKKLFLSFTGTIKQLPPVRSAVARRERERSIYVLEFLEMDKRDVLFKVSCEAGTYVRKLCHDMGQNAAVGAHMVELRRTRAGKFDEKNIFTLQNISDGMWLAKKGNEEEIRKMVIPIENALSLSKIWIKDSAVGAICAGAQLAKPGVLRYEEFERGEKVAIMTQLDELVGVAEAILNSREVDVRDKGQICKTESVILSPGLYPKVWGDKDLSFKA